MYQAIRILPALALKTVQKSAEVLRNVLPGPSSLSKFGKILLKLLWGISIIYCPFWRSNQCWLKTTVMNASDSNDWVWGEPCITTTTTTATSTTTTISDSKYDKKSVFFAKLMFHLKGPHQCTGKHQFKMLLQIDCCWSNIHADPCWYMLIDWCWSFYFHLYVRLCLLLRIYVESVNVTCS